MGNNGEKNQNIVMQKNVMLYGTQNLIRIS